MSKQDFVLKKTTPQKFLKVLEIHLAEHCNLYCFSCSHFSQLAKEAYYDLKEFEQDIKRLKVLTKGNIERFHLLGGEPLLNPDVLKYFALLRENFTHSHIWLITNGILLLKQDESFFQTCSKLNIELHPTKYPIEIDWQRVDELCKRYKVTLKFYNNAKIEKNSMKFVLNLEKQNDIYESFTQCFMSNFCVQLKEGKIYTCNICANIEHFNAKFKTTLMPSDEDCIDIYKAKNYEEILEFLAKPIPFCAYCDVKNWKSIGKWKRSEKSINEYLI